MVLPVEAAALGFPGHLCSQAWISFLAFKGPPTDHPKSWLTGYYLVCQLRTRNETSPNIQVTPLYSTGKF